MLGCICRLYRRQKTSRAFRKLKRTTDISLEDPMAEETTRECNEEACLTEGPKFVGATAKFDGAWKIIPLRPDLLPTEYYT
jgi:hypothetical protein